MNGTEVSASEIRARAQAIAGRCVERMPSWPVGEIHVLYEELDSLASSAGQFDQQAIADAAIELTVYLSSLVESGFPANAAQRSRAVALAENLAAASSDGRTRRSRPVPDADGQNHRAVFYLRADGLELPGLTAQLGHAGYLVRSFNDASLALAEVRNRAPDALIVESNHAAQLAQLLEAAEAGRSGTRSRPLALVQNDSGDRRQRLFAQRAGADLVIEGDTAEQLVRRLDELFVAEKQEQACILVVDDDRSMALFCQTVLGHKGITTRIANSAEQAFELLAEFRPDLILLDLYLTDMNGIEVAQWIRERPDMAMVPILFMSGEESLDQRFDAIRMGGDDFLLKPIKPRHLIASVSARVRRSRQWASLNSSAGAASPSAGRIDRSTLVHELARSRRGELGDCVALVLLAVDDVPNLARRLGFVRTGDLAQQIVTQLALEGIFAGGICVLGEFSLLGLVSASGEGALRLICDKLRARLQGRGWLSAEAPESVSFSLVALRVDDHSAGIDDLLSRLSHRLLDAQDQGGGQSIWLPTATALRTVQTPGELLARAILKRPLLAETTSIQFRPLLPIQGKHTGQNLVRLRLVAPRSTLAENVIDAATYLPIAREIHMLNRVDRWLIDALARRIPNAAGGELRILVPLSGASLNEPAFADWLLAELHKHKLDGDALALVFELADLQDDLPGSTRALEHLQTTGARLFLRGFTDDGRDAMRLLRLASSYGIILGMQAPTSSMDAGQWAQCRKRLVNEAQRHGKIVVIDQVDRAEYLSDLFRDNVHYAVGDAVGDWLDEPTSEVATCL